MKVFVTGATGLIGGSAVRALVARGHEVTGLTSRPAGKSAVEALGAKAVVGDMRDASAYGDVVRGSDAVLHAAAALPDKMRLSQKDVDAFMGAEVGAVDALASVLGPSCRAFVVTSGAYVYGDTGETPVDETRSTASHHRVMAKKVEMENRILARAKAGEIPAIVVRPGLVYGDGSLWKKLYLDAMRKKSRAMMPGRGDQMISFVHVDDVGTALRTIVESPKPGEIYNVADDLPERLGVVVRFQAEALGAPPPRSIPPWFLRLVAGDLGGGPTLAHTALANEKLRALGWTPTYPTYRDGIPALSATLR
jgi:nucleoside-diphosphate-sugar epimerase